MPTAKANGVNLFYEVAGEGFPLVLVSGFGADRLGWVDYQFPFFSQYYRTVIYDKRGTGQSDKPDISYTMEMFADDTIGLMDALGMERAHIVGISMGGVIAQTLGINYPDRVQSLVLSNTYMGVGGSPNLELSVRKWTGQAIQAGDFKPDLRDLLIHFTPDFILRNNEVLQRYTSRQGTAGHILARYAEATRATNTLPHLHKIKAPTLVLIAEEDYRMRAWCDYLHEEIKHSEFALMPGRHLSNLEFPEIYNARVLEFTLKHTPKEFARAGAAPTATKA
ncbi:MAG: alpha/beta fold hydrolase [Dehalococcoidia bacterium]